MQLAHVQWDHGLKVQLGPYLLPERATKNDMFWGFFAGIADFTRCGINNIFLEKHRATLNSSL
jgi:hypothetical protein